MRIPIHSKPGSHRSILLAVVFAITLAGCAVLTVDVDVYKGPLSNHPEVQLQQAVAMATAATPLLVQLRDESEVLFALQLKRHGWWLLPASLSKVSEDVTKWRSDHLTAIYDQETNRRRASGSSYYPGLLMSDRAKRVNDILGLFDDLPDPILANLISRLQADVMTMTNLLASYTNATTIFSTNGIQSPPTATSKTGEPAKGNKNRESSPAWIESIQDVGTPGDYTNNSKIYRDNFAAATNSRMNALQSDPEKLKALQETISTNSSVFLRFPEEITKEANELIGISFGTIAEFKSLQQRSHYNLEEAIQSAASLAVDSMWPVNTDASNALVRANINSTEFATKTAMIKSMSNKPEIWLFALRTCEGAGFFNIFDPGNSKNIFGEGIFSIQREAIKMARDAATLLQRGRLASGIHTLTENFLDITQRDPKSPEAQNAKQALLQELVRFSEKVLFLANNNDLLEPESKWKGLAAGAISLFQNGVHDIRTGEDKARSYKFILQAIGNSILVQIDELSERQSHDINSAASSTNELAAIKAAFRSDARTAFQNILSAIKAQITPIKNSGADLTNTVGKIETAKKADAEAKSKLNGLFATATDDQLTAAATFLSPEPAAITNLWARRYENPAQLAADALQAVNALIAATNSPNLALRGLSDELKRVQVSSENTQILSNKASLALLTDALPAITNAQSAWAVNVESISTAYRLGTNSAIHLLRLSTDLTRFATNLTVTNLPPADLTNAQLFLSNAAVGLRGHAAMTNIGFIALSNSFTFASRSGLDLKSLATVASNSIVTLTREPDLATEIPECFSSSVKPLTNGFTQIADATNWQTVGAKTYTDNMVDLSNAVVLIQGPHDTNQFLVRSQALSDSILRLKGHLDAMQLATNSQNGIAGYTNLLSCITNSAGSLSRFIDDPKSANRSLRFWATLKGAMIADIVTFKELSKAADQTKTNLESLNAKLAELTTQNARFLQLSNAQSAIEDWQGKTDNNPYGENSYARFILDLRTKRDLAKKTPASDKVDLKKTSSVQFGDALDVLDEFGPPIDASALELADGVEGKHHTKDALDSLIARLRYEHLRAVEEAGENSPRAVSLAQSIRVAYEQRTGMIYIRPASSYLRTSYPSTSLQADASIGWRNMLSEHMRRQTPIFGSWLEDRSNLSTILEVDKQFWQNINRVRVAGGGRGNYVVAKDDLGNWYVKQYASDPKDVINSAKNLAMFSLGPTLGGTLPINNSVPGSILSTNITSPNGKSLLEFQLESFQSNYVAQTKETYTNLSQTLTRKLLQQKLAAAVASASTNSAESAKLTNLVETAAQSLVELPAIPDKPDNVEKALNATLLSLVQVHYALDSATLSAEVPPPVKDIARKNARQTLFNAARDPLRQRMEAVSALRNGVTILNSSLNQNGSQAH